MRGEILFSEPIYGAIFTNGNIEWNVIHSFMDGINIIKTETSPVIGIAVKNRYFMSSGFFKSGRLQKFFISGMIVSKETALNLCDDPDDKKWISEQSDRVIMAYNFKTQRIVRLTKNFRLIP